MNRKGFTLIELLFVVIIMSIIALITIPNIFEMLQSSKDKKYEEYEKILIDNLKLYNIDYKEDLWKNDVTSVNVTYDQLLKVNNDINIEGCTATNLQIEKQDNSYKYHVCMTCNVDNKYKTYGSGC